MEKLQETIKVYISWFLRIFNRLKSRLMHCFLQTLVVGFLELDISCGQGLYFVDEGSPLRDVMKNITDAKLW